MVTKDTEKAEVLSVVFATVFTCKTGPQESQIPETSGKVWRQGKLTLSGGGSG